MFRNKKKKKREKRLKFTSKIANVNSNLFNQYKMHKNSNATKKNKKQSKPRAGKGNVIPGSKNFGVTTTISELWTPIFPARRTVKLRYSDYATLSSASGVVAAYVFTANGLYDPNRTGTGHQPMGFDQMCLSYEHFCVVSSRITVTFRNTTSSTPTVAIAVSPSTTNLTSIPQLIESGALQMTVLEYKGADGSCQTLQVAMRTTQFHGVVDALDDPSLQGSAAADPVEGSYYILYLWDTLGVSGSCSADVVIEYTAIFTEPRQLTESLQKRIHSLVREETTQTVMVPDNKKDTERKERK